MVHAPSISTLFWPVISQRSNANRSHLPKVHSLNGVFPLQRYIFFLQIASILYCGKVLHKALKMICIYGIKGIDILFERF